MTSSKFPIISDDLARQIRALSGNRALLDQIGVKIDNQALIDATRAFAQAYDAVMPFAGPDVSAQVRHITQDFFRSQGEFAKTILPLIAQMQATLPTRAIADSVSAYQKTLASMGGQAALADMYESIRRTINTQIAIAGIPPPLAYAHQSELASLQRAVSQSISAIRAHEDEVEANRDSYDETEWGHEISEHYQLGAMALIDLQKAALPFFLGNEAVIWSLKNEVELISPLLQDHFAAYVVVIDLRKSTDMMLNCRDHRLFAEFLLELRRGIREVTHECGGIYEGSTGDGAMVFFPECYSGRDAGIRAVECAERCHALFSRLRDDYEHTFNVVSDDAGLGIGIDYGDIVATFEGAELAISGTPVVYATRFSDVAATKTAVNQQAYQQLRKYQCIDLQESSVAIKGRGPSKCHLASLKHPSPPFEPARFERSQTGDSETVIDE